MDQSAHAVPRLSLAMTIMLGAVLIAWWLGAVVVFPSLPALLPTHYDFAGVADGPLRSKGQSWFIPPVLASMSFLLMELTLRRSVRYPELINVPRQDVFLRLGPEERAPVFRELQVMMELMTACIFASMLVWQVAVYQAAMHGMLSLAPAASRVGFLALFAVLIPGIRGAVRINATLRSLA